MRWTSGIMQVGGHTAKPSSSNKRRGCFHVLKVLGKKKDSRIVESFLKEFSVQVVREYFIFKLYV